MRTHVAIAQFCEAKAVVWRSPRTAKGYLSILNQLENTYPELPEAASTLELFLATRRVSAYSLHTYFSKLRTFYRWASRRLGIENPFPDMEAPSGRRPRPRILSLAELNQLLSYPAHSALMELLLNVLADTGIRIGEATRLTGDNITIDSILVTGKTGTREVPCSSDLCAAMMDKGRIFPYHVDTLKHMVHGAFTQAGFTGRKLGPHTLRHTFAKLWEGSEGDLQGILGHRSPAMTLWYRQFRIDRAKRDHARYSPRNRSKREGGHRQPTLFRLA